MGKHFSKNLSGKYSDKIAQRFEVNCGRKIIKLKKLF